MHGGFYRQERLPRTKTAKINLIRRPLRLMSFHRGSTLAHSRERTMLIKTVLMKNCWKLESISSWRLYVKWPVALACRSSWGKTNNIDNMVRCRERTLLGRYNVFKSLRLMYWHGYILSFLFVAFVGSFNVNKFKEICLAIANSPWRFFTCIHIHPPHVQFKYTPPLSHAYVHHYPLLVYTYCVTQVCLRGLVLYSVLYSLLSPWVSCVVGLYTFFFLCMNICNELLKGHLRFQWLFFCISSSVHSGFLDPRGLGNSWHAKAALYWMTSDVFAVMTKWITTWVVWWALEENQLEIPR